MEIRFKFCVDGQYIKSLTPIVLTNDVKEAYTLKVVDADKTIDEAFIKLELLKGFDEALTSDDIPSVSSYQIQMYTDTDTLFYITEATPKRTSGGTTDRTLDSEYYELASYITTSVGPIIQDLIDDKAKSMMPTGLEEALKETLKEMKSAMGPKKVEATDDIDKLIEDIKNNTQAEVVRPKETLAEYVCPTVLREELEEIVDFFKNEEVYRKAGVSLPKGILFKGAPGTGKTFAARCIAGTVDCYFMICTASSLQGQYIGSGAGNIKQVFSAAKMLADVGKKKVIIFIDEIDSFGSRASAKNSGGEESRTINQLLAEMSGFEDDSDIMVMAATNYPERLDDALMRSGRFGRQITIDYPDKTERISLVEHYFNKLNIKINEEEATTNDIADLAEGLVPADIKEIANESAILSIRHKTSKININDINEAINKVITKNIRHPDKDADEQYLVAAHECGHVLAEIAFNNTHPIKVTNYSYGDAGGFTQSGEIFQGIINKNKYLARVRMLLGGRAAEAVMRGFITTGASSDLDKAKRLIRAYYEDYNFEEYEASKLDQLVLDKLHEEYRTVVSYFEAHVEDLKALTSALIASRVLYKADLIAMTTKGGFKL